MAWDLGDTIPLAVEVTDGQGDLANATSVVLTVTLPDGETTVTPSVTNPSTGRYEAEYVPDEAGLHVVHWRAVDPAAVFVDVLDVRPAAEVGVVSLADAKAHLNQTAGRTVEDEELRPILQAATERVARHLGVDALSSPITASQRLAVLEVLGELWERSQRARYGGTRSAGYGGGAGGGQDAVPRLPLQRRLDDILGPPVGARPTGSFPDAEEWPE